MDLCGYLLGIYEEEQEERNRYKQRFRELKIERRLLRDACNVFTLCPEYFRKYYRFTPEVALRLINELEPQLMGFRQSALPPHIQVLCVLRFLAEGSYQKGFSQDFHHPISQPAASTCITKVVNAINSTLSQRYLQFPTTVEERRNIQTRFRRTIRIPGVIDLIDCFIVAIARPTENEEAFYHYRHGHGLIVQIIVDAKYNILNLRTCPASNNDRYVWQFFQAKQYMETLRAEGGAEINYYLLGDSGYTPSSVLLTSILDAQEGTAEAAYTGEHVGTRCRVEQTIGLLTTVWRVIRRARKLQYTPEKIGKIVNACAILHNYRRRHGIYHENIAQVRAQRNIDLMDQPGDNPDGLAERQRIIATCDEVFWLGLIVR